MKTKWALFFLLIFCIFCSSCKHKKTVIKWNYSDKEVIGEKPVKRDQIDLDVYVDATTSMEGFVTPNSNYSLFLDQLRESAISSWRNANIYYFKFGTRIKPIDYTEYLKAKYDINFYRDYDIKLRTYIDSVVNRTNLEKLSVVITDLFQNEGDVGTMVTQFKDKCFQKGVAVGILGIESLYNGKVYDAGGAYPLVNKQRPFYAVIFGNQYNMDLLFESLRSKSSGQSAHSLVFSNTIVKSFSTTLSKDKKSKDINNKKSSEDLKNSFDFGLKETGTGGNLNLVVDFELNPNCADFDEKALEIEAYKKTGADLSNPSANGNLTDDITIQNLKRNKNKLEGNILLQNKDPKGLYSYKVLLKTNQLRGLKLPVWISNFSTPNPIPGTPSASRTYNLEKLGSMLLNAQSSITPTYIAKFYVNVYKR